MIDKIIYRLRPLQTRVISVYRSMNVLYIRPSKHGTLKLDGMTGKQ